MCSLFVNPSLCSRSRLPCKIKGFATPIEVSPRPQAFDMRMSLFFTGQNGVGTGSEAQPNVSSESKWGSKKNPSASRDPPFANLFKHKMVNSLKPNFWLFDL